ncbi:MAG TPA: chemotaxis protein CheA [Terriglobales bacterium]|nr:chemotaxis protein CheA [Terriglobales bacterium]
MKNQVEPIDESGPRSKTVRAMSDNDIIQDFLAESGENLDRLDRELVGLEKNPSDKDALAGIFRTIHTIKGTCGFLGFNKLEKVAHVGENLLTRLRDGQLTLNPEITTALLEMVDAIRQMLDEIRNTGQDGQSDYPKLRETLTRLQSSTSTSEATAVAAQPATPAAIAPSAPPQEAAKTAAADAPTISSPSPADVAPAKPPSTSSTSAQVQQASETKPRDGAGETIRVAVNLLDKLMTLVGELVLARNQLLQFSNSLDNTGLHAICQRLDLIASELQEEVMKTRMQPIGNIWAQFPRTVRDVALACNKKVSIEMEGKETELDKTIIEAIKDPLTHLVRNSVDHGIELPEDRVKAGKDATGRLTLRAFHEGGQVIIEIGDDGAGLNHERIRQKALERKLITGEQAARMSMREISNLIFMPGFSTAAKVTNVSGRGVGMDVVKTNVEKIGGAVDVQSTPGQGTTVRIKIPLTLAIIPALVVNCRNERYAIPQVNLLELVRLDGEQLRTGIEMVHGVPVYRLRGRLLPLVYLAGELQLQGSDDLASSGRLLPLVYLARELQLQGSDNLASSRPSAANIVVLQADERQFGLVVDGIGDTEEIVVKPLRKQLKTVKIFAGSSIMGDGKVALIVDVLGLAQRASVVSETRDRAVVEKIAESTAAAEEKQTFMLFAGLVTHGWRFR